MIIIGEPGLGKSKLLIQTLKEHGYRKTTFPLDPTQDTNRLYAELPVSLGLEEQKKFYLQAADAGIPVINDELNSSPLMEQFINDLIMGKRPQNDLPEDPKDKNEL